MVLTESQKIRLQQGVMVVRCHGGKVSQWRVITMAAERDRVTKYSLDGEEESARKIGLVKTLLI